MLESGLNRKTHRLTDPRCLDLLTAFCLKFLNSCANPIALYCVSGVFRKKFQRYLGWLVRGGRGRRRSSSSAGLRGLNGNNTSSMRIQRITCTRRQRTRTTLVTTFMNGNAVN